MLKTLFSVLCITCQVHGWGYRYNFNPVSGEANLWTYLPGHEQPVVYDYQPGFDWPQVYTVPYDGLLPSTPNFNFAHGNYRDDPHLYKYRGSDGRQKYKCKPQAYYSEYQKKCLWKPGYYNRNRP